LIAISASRVQLFFDQSEEGSFHDTKTPSFLPSFRSSFLNCSALRALQLQLCGCNCELSLCAVELEREKDHEGKQKQTRDFGRQKKKKKNADRDQLRELIKGEVFL